MDDSEETRQALRELLEARAITIVGEAAEGAEGIDLAREPMPDVVLMDLKMPGMGRDRGHEDDHQQSSRYARHRAHDVRR